MTLPQLCWIHFLQSIFKDRTNNITTSKPMWVIQFQQHLLAQTKKGSKNTILDSLASESFACFCKFCFHKRIKAVIFSTLSQILSGNQYFSIKFLRNVHCGIPQNSCSRSDIQNRFAPWAHSILNGPEVGEVPLGIVEHDEVPALHQPVCNAVKILLGVSKVRVELHCFVKIGSCFVSEAHSKSKSDKGKVCMQLWTSEGL